jgi:hypothetical protein
MHPENKDQELTMRNLLLHLNFICWKSLEFDFIKKQILVIILFLFAAVSSNSQPHIENDTLNASQDSVGTSEESHTAQSREELGILFVRLCKRHVCHYDKRNYPFYKK